MIKTCLDCKEEKEHIARGYCGVCYVRFYRENLASDEVKKKKAIYNRAWMKQSFKDKQLAINEIKIDSGCVDCGYAEHPVALDFDHVRGIKEYGIAQMRKKFTLKKLLKEIEKCEVRCANCHRIATYNRLIDPTQI